MTAPEGGSEAAAKALERRARRLAEPAATEPVDAVELLVFSACEDRLAVPASRVREILAPGPTTRLPARVRTMAGLRAASGAAIVLADPLLLLGVAEAAPPPVDTRFAVVLDHPTAPLGLLADRVDGVATALGGLQDVSDRSLIEGLTPEGVPVLDVDAILADARLTGDAPG